MLQVKTDKELVQRALVLSDRQAYSELVNKYQREIRAYLFRRTRDRESADDIAQDTFLQGFRSLAQLKEADKFRGWIYSIAHQQFLQAYRSRGKELPMSASELIESDEEAPPEIQNDSTEQMTAGRDLKTLLGTLRPIEQEAIILCLGHELTHTEAASMLQISIGTVKSLVLRGREKLRLHHQAFSLGGTDGGSNGN